MLKHNLPLMSKPLTAFGQPSPPSLQRQPSSEAVLGLTPVAMPETIGTINKQPRRVMGAHPARR